MTTSIRPGEQLASTVCATRVVVVKAPAGATPDIACGGAPMVPAASVPPAKTEEAEAITLIGKRYVDSGETIELLCTHSGAGELTSDGVPMTLKTAKALPASD